MRRDVSRRARFPPADSPALYTADWGRDWAYRHRMTPNGSTFAADQAPWLNLRRITDLDADGLGHVYASSWKGASFTYVGEDVGFIVQLKAKGKPVDPLPAFNTLGRPELVNLLRSPSARRRLEAQRALLRNGIDDPTFSDLLHLAADPAAPVASRIAAIFAAKQGLGERSHDGLARLASDPKVREAVLRATSDRLDQMGSVPWPLFVSSLSDPDPRVRLRAAVGIARGRRVEFASNLIRLLDDPDPLVRHTTVASLVALKASDACLTRLDRYHSTGEHGLTNTLRVLQSLHEPKVVARLVDRLDNPALRFPLFTALCRLHDVEGRWKGDSWGTRPDTSGPYYQAERWAETPAIERGLRSALESETSSAVLAGMLDSLALHKIALTEGRFVFLDRDGLNDLVGRAQAQPKLVPGLLYQIARLENVPESAEAFLIGLATKPETPTDSVAKAVEGLAKRNSEKALFASFDGLSLLNRSEEGKRTLGRIRPFVLDPKTLGRRVDSLLVEAAKLSGDRSAWADAGLLQVGSGPAAKAIESGMKEPKRAAQILRAVALAEHRPSADRVRSALNDPNPAVAQAAREAASALRLDGPGGANRPTGPTVKAIGIDRALERVVTVKGTRQAGEAIFQRLNCMNCHTVDPHEPPKGPYLGTIAATYKRKELAEAILRPSKTLAQGFVTVALGLDDGSTVVGFVVKEAADAVTIRTADAKEFVIPTKRIEERAKRDVSVMPEGLVDGLTVREFASLLDYLESPRAK